MTHEPFVIEKIFNASVAKVWKAITDKDDMKQWYFDLAAFKPEVGFEFRFKGGPEDGIQYEHVCVITEVVVNNKLTYSWRYEGFEGISYVSFELFEEGNQTRVKLTHTGLETFPAHPDFAKKNFEAGWNAIIGSSLKEYVEQ